MRMQPGKAWRNGRVFQLTVFTLTIVVFGFGRSASCHADDAAGDRRDTGAAAETNESPPFGIVIAPRPKIDAPASERRASEPLRESNGRKNEEAQSESGDAPPFGIVISPRRKLSKLDRVAEQPAAASAEGADGDLDATEPADDLPIIVPQPVHRPRYVEIYNSIPFSRTEYDANPSYRHEAAMEILTGNPRPPKIDLSRPVPPHRPTLVPLNPYNPPVLRQFFDVTRGPYSRYQHLFGYQGGYRPRFYHY